MEQLAAGNNFVAGAARLPGGRALRLALGGPSNGPQRAPAPLTGNGRASVSGSRHCAETKYQADWEQATGRSLVCCRLSPVHNGFPPGAQIRRVELEREKEPLARQEWRPIIPAAGATLWAERGELLKGRPISRDQLAVLAQDFIFNPRHQTKLGHSLPDTRMDRQSFGKMMAAWAICMRQTSGEWN